jgi:hypothetical protein
VVVGLDVRFPFERKLELGDVEALAKLLRRAFQSEELDLEVLEVGDDFITEFICPLILRCMSDQCSRRLMRIIRLYAKGCG